MQTGSTTNLVSGDDSIDGNFVSQGMIEADDAAPGTPPHVVQSSPGWVINEGLIGVAGGVQLAATSEDGSNSTIWREALWCCTNNAQA